MIIGGIGTEAYQNGYSYTTSQTKRNISDTIFAKTIEDVKNANDTITSNTSTALDAYHVLLSNKVQDIPTSYETYQSENYKIVSDNEAECFDIYNVDGERLGSFDYSDIKIKVDSATGKELLISEHGTMSSYDAIAWNDELKEDFKNIMGKENLETEELQGYTLKTHSGTGIQYLVRDGEEGRGGKTPLQSESDIKKYNEFAQSKRNRILYGKGK